MSLNSPLFIIGSARSGTDILSKHVVGLLGVPFIGENNEIWKSAQPVPDCDFVTRRNIRMHALEGIRDKLAAKAGSEVFLEKTPSNSLRPAVVRAAYPESKILHLIRDGRDVVVSAMRKYAGDIRKISHGSEDSSSRLSRLLRVFQYKLGQGVPWPASLSSTGHYVKSVGSLLGIGNYLWGPKFPGWRYCMKHLRPHEVAAIQWKWSVDCMLNFIANEREETVFTVRYEDFIDEPDAVLSRISEFLNVEPEANSRRIPDTVILNTAVGQWRTEMSEEVLSDVSGLIKQELILLGYMGSSSVKYR